MLKKAITILLAAAMLSGTAVFAENAVVTSNTDEAVVTNVEVNEGFVKDVVTVKEIGEDYILVASENESELQLNVGDETILIDSVTGSSIEISDIKPEDKIQVEYSQAMTRSIPAQTFAYLIVANFEDGGCVNYINVDEVTTDENGNIIITDNTNDIILTASDKVQTFPYKTKNIVKAQDIVKGSKILAWYDVVTMSIPAQAATEKVVILNEAVVSEDSENTEDTEATKRSFVINGQNYDDIAEVTYYNDGIVMVPLRKVSEALGYSVGWDAQTGAITVENGLELKATLFGGNKNIEFTTAQKIAGVNRTVEAETEIVIDNGCTFVPVKFFSEFSNIVKVDGMNIEISKAE